MHIAQSLQLVETQRRGKVEVETLKGQLVKGFWPIDITNVEYSRLDPFRRTYYKTSKTGWQWQAQPEEYIILPIQGPSREQRNLCRIRILDRITSRARCVNQDYEPQQGDIVCMTDDRCNILEWHVWEGGRAWFIVVSANNPLQDFDDRYTLLEKADTQ